MQTREELSVPAAGGSLAGWVAGSGQPVLLLHGGPGLSYSYLDDLGVELAAEFHVASYQQRGLDPSTLEGPHTIAQSIDDVITVLDGLGWSQAFVVGHSWGDFRESMEILWPAYFADPEKAPPAPPIQASSEVFMGINPEMGDGLEEWRPSSPRLTSITRL